MTIEERVLSFIRNPQEGDFASLALAVFEHQFCSNPPYRRFCLSRGRTPQTVKSWQEIPAVPTAAFKELELACGPAEKVFWTSGTTRGREKRGRHWVPRLELYRESALSHFAACLLPDGARLCMLALVPSPQTFPHSSLAQMVEWVMEAYGEGEGRYFVDSEGVHLEEFAAELGRVERQGRAVGILALTQALVGFFELCEVRGLRFSLPRGSRIMDTGGNKGKGTVMGRSDFFKACRKYLGVPEPFCVSEYGMAELCSQFYDNVLCCHLAQDPKPRFKVGPSWTRTLVVDPETFAELPPGEVGLLRHWDLANCGSVLAVQTDDLGYKVGEGFEILGRAGGAEARGCALLLEELLSVS